MFSSFAGGVDSELVVVVSLDPSFEQIGEESSVRRIPFRGLITDLGFSAGPGQPITSRQPRESQSDTWVLHDRFSITEEGDRHGVGSVELREKFAYDLQHRSEIPWTGIAVALHLSAKVMEAYLGYLGDLAFPPDSNWISSDHWRGLIFRFPVRQFDLPLQRGGFDLKIDSARIGELREISNFKIDRMTVQKLQSIEGHGAKAIDGLPEDSSLVVPSLQIGA